MVYHHGNAYAIQMGHAMGGYRSFMECHIAIESEAGNMEGHMGFLLCSNQRLGRIWHWWFKKNHGRHMGGQKAFAKLEATCSTWEAMLLLLKARGIHHL